MDKINHSHGDVGTKPNDNEDFQSGEIANSETFDWSFSVWPNTIDQIIDYIHTIDPEEDGVVAEAEYANDADASAYKGNDIDSNGDGVVDNADHANNADELDGNSPSDLKGGGGGINLPSTNIAEGEYIALARHPSLAPNTELSIKKASVCNGSFEQKQNLQLVVVTSPAGGWNGNILETYNDSDSYLVDDGPYTVGGENLLIAVQNGFYGSSTGTAEENVTATIDYTLE